MENILEIQVCYHSRINRKELIKKIVENNLFGFSPELMNIDYTNRKYDVDKAIKLIERSERNTGIIFNTENENITLTINFIALIEGALSLIWSIKKNVINDYSFLDFFINEGDFMSAYMYDYNYVYWQSETSISEYEINNKNHKKLKKIKDQWDEIVIDISSNYGRKVLLKNTSLCAAPKMWFSNMFFEITGVDKNKILNYEGVKTINENVIEIILFDNASSSDNEENRFKQKAFWEYAKFDDVEKKLYPY